MATEPTKLQRAGNKLLGVVSGKVQQVYDDHVDAMRFRHHNPYFLGDAASLKVGMEESERTQPGKILVVHHAIEDGLVALHSHLIVRKGEIEVAVVHISRFQGDKIVEVWDIAQQVPKQMKNQVGMF